MIHAEFYNRYIHQINTEQSILELLTTTLEEFNQVIKQKGSNWWSTPYDAGKWTPKELVMHLIDVERVYQFRAHCIAAGETSEMAGFDENQYVKNSHANELEEHQLLGEFWDLRKASVWMFKRFSNPMLNTSGKADGKPVDVEALGYIMAVHLHHHTQILKTRYL